MAGMTASQLRELEMFHSIEPLGEYRNELRHGGLMALTANINRDEKLKPKPFTAADFMNFEEDINERQLSEEELEAEFKKIFGC